MLRPVVRRLLCSCADRGQVFEPVYTSINTFIPQEFSLGNNSSRYSSRMQRPRFARILSADPHSARLAKFLAEPVYARHPSPRPILCENRGAADLHHSHIMPYRLARLPMATGSRADGVAAHRHAAQRASAGTRHSAFGQQVSRLQQCKPIPVMLRVLGLSGTSRCRAGSSTLTICRCVDYFRPFTCYYA
jgi:hypothetical protein